MLTQRAPRFRLSIPLRRGGVYVRRVAEAAYYAFPTQLLLLHLRKNKLMLFFWALLFGMVTQQIGRIFGLPYLFLDPEYVNQVGFGSLYLMGLATGGFTMAFHISCYILDSRKFPFLAGCRRPITRFCINNSPVPFAFMLTYLYCFARFQANNEALSSGQIAWQALGLVLGFVTMILVMFYYLVITNYDVQRLATRLQQRVQRRRQLNRVKVITRITEARRDIIRVDSYFESLYRVRRVNATVPVENRAILKMFDQNYLNAIFIELLVIVTVFIIGIFRDDPTFQLPAGASIILLLTIFLMLVGAVSFWLKRWSMTFTLLLLVVANYLTAKEFFKTSYEAYGMAYALPPAEFSLSNIQRNYAHYEADRQQTLRILRRWRAKFTGPAKPKMVFVCASGGGQRAALWTMRALQYADSLSDGALMPHTQLMTGASGGLVGASFFRELYLRKTQRDTFSLYDPRFLDDIARDNLNAIAFSLVVNDIFFRFQKFDYRGQKYFKDRGYAFEQQLNKNTDGFLDKTLADYRAPEASAQIPMLLVSPTVVNDGRKLYISPQPVAYLAAPAHQPAGLTDQKTPGIEFRRFFAKQNADNLRFLSALRMGATFPYVTPNVILPSRPEMEIMDAGLSDNFGVNDAVRFLYAFREWIADNTSGVVLVCIRDTPKDEPIEKNVQPSLFQRIFTPIGSLYNNWVHLQDLNNDQALEFAQAWFGNRIDRVEFEYTPRLRYGVSFANRRLAKDSTRADGASLSWHLTQFEKADIHQAILEPGNQAAGRRLRALLR